MPIISTILGIAAVASSVAGVAEQHSQQKTQQQGLQDQNAIAQQEMQDKQKAFDQAESFYTPYTQSGSPFLQNIQAAGAAQSAQQGNNAAGQFREQVGQTGLGYGPSGTMASGLAQIGSSQAASGASNYLQNLLNNEQIKFQAQQGLTSAGQMAGSTQNQPNVNTTLPPASTASSIGAFGQALNSLSNPPNNTSTTSTSTTNTPLPTQLPPGTVNLPPAVSSGTPTTQGWGFPT
jgi:hypothetical protein